MKLYVDYSDEELLVLLQDSDHYAYSEIYNRYKRSLYIHAYRRLKSEVDVDDIIHDLFTALWLRREDIVLKGSLASYLYTAIRNRILDFIAHKQVESAYVVAFQKFLDEPVNVTDYLIRENQLKDIIDKEIALLPDKMQEIFKLSRKGGLSHREIAEKLHISEKTVKNQVNNALKILRARLGLFVWLLLLIFY